LIVTARADHKTFSSPLEGFSKVALEALACIFCLFGEKAGGARFFTKQTENLLPQAAENNF
jgi:hypothetical protein